MPKPGLQFTWCAPAESGAGITAGTAVQLHTAGRWNTAQTALKCPAMKSLRLLHTLPRSRAALVLAWHLYPNRCPAHRMHNAHQILTIIPTNHHTRCLGSGMHRHGSICRDDPRRAGARPWLANCHARWHTRSINQRIRPTRGVDISTLPARSSACLRGR